MIKTYQFKTKYNSNKVIALKQKISKSSLYYNDETHALTH